MKLETVAPFDQFVEDLIELHAELDEQIVSVEKMLRAAGVQIAEDVKEAPAPKQRRKKASAKKRSNKQTMSRESLDKILGAVGRIDGPVPTRTVADMVADLSPSSVGRGLKILAGEGAIREVGYEQGVRGRRPLYEAEPAVVIRHFGNGVGEEAQQADERVGAATVGGPGSDPAGS